MSAAAGIVVTEMNTPMRAPVRASTSETTPDDAGEHRDHDREHVGRVDQVGHRPEPEPEGLRLPPGGPHDDAEEQRRDDGDEEADAERDLAGTDPMAIALPDAERDADDRRVLGPTTMAPTIRICEFVKMPTAAMSPAIVSRMYQLGG